MTPFDRDDIHVLATALDDVVDNIEEASDLLGLYGWTYRRASHRSGRAHRLRGRAPVDAGGT